ncbi:MAG: type II secretion system protein [Jatrophihabitans sp.]|uniref:type II secretion system protein n=1 Tax=Jatrophihabitans sp. TaxID=1932789 RepID=UPI003F7DD1DF
MTPLERRLDEARPDDGFTLVELILAIAILGGVIAALVGAMFTNIKASDYNRKQATVDTILKDYAEALNVAVSARTGASWCLAGSTTTNYAPAYTAPTGYTVSGSAPNCPTFSANTAQYQVVTITASSQDARDSETLRVVVRPTCILTGSSC